jgi:hypothetical protein
VKLQYQEVDENRRFDVINLDNYDVILGTPFLFQHKVLLGLNPMQVDIGSGSSLPIKGEQITTLSSLAADLLEERLEALRQELIEYAKDICKDPADAPLPAIQSNKPYYPID